jgi:hypothetical protein
MFSEPVEVPERRHLHLEREVYEAHLPDSPLVVVAAAVEPLAQVAWEQPVLEATS